MRICQVSDADFDLFWRLGEEQLAGVTVFYTEIFRRYDRLMFSEKLVADDSFVVISEMSEILALVPLYVFRNEGGALQYSYGMDYLRGPVFAKGMGKKTFEKTAELVFKTIDELALRRGVSRVLLMIEPVELLEQRHYYNYYLDYGYADASAVDCLLEYDKDEAFLWADIRKSYRPLIHKAERAYKSVVIHQEGFDFDLCEEYRKMHHLAAGRVTRPTETFYHMYEMIKEGNAFLILIRDGQRTLGAYYFLVKGLYGFYGSAATDPSLDSQSGVGHFGLWSGIVFAKQQGCRFMDLGQLLLRPGGVTDKEKNIFLFKTGFGGQKVVVFRGVKELIKKEG